MSTLFQSELSTFVSRKGGDEDDGNSIPSTLELTLHIETGSFRHLNICNDAANIIELPRIEQLINRGE